MRGLCWRCRRHDMHIHSGLPSNISFLQGTYNSYIFKFIYWNQWVGDQRQIRLYAYSYSVLIFFVLHCCANRYNTMIKWTHTDSKTRDYFIVPLEHTHKIQSLYCHAKFAYPGIIHVLCSSFWTGSTINIKSLKAVSSGLQALTLEGYCHLFWAKSPVCSKPLPAKQTIQPFQLLNMY